MSGLKSITTVMRDSALWLTLNRPDRLNSLSMEMVREISDVLDRTENNSEVKSIVITGTGRAFCAGADLKDAGNGASPLNARLYGSISSMLRQLELLPKPVIAAINGIAVAGGLELALCCDIVVADRTAAIGDAHARYGLLPGGGGSVRLPRAVGATRAKYMMFTAKTFTAEEMRDWGLIQEVVEPGNLVSAVDDLTEILAAKSPLGLKRMKQLIDNGLDQPLVSALAAEQITCELHDASQDRNEGLSAFMARRSPKFTGV